MKKKRRISIQKIFCLISFLFLLGCTLFYGIKFIKLYMDNNKTSDGNIINLAKKIKNDHANHDYFKNINSEYYFTGKVDNNYLSYANLTWRVMKVNNRNSVILILDEPITALAYDDKITSYQKSPIYKWLNKTSDKNSGILENILKKEQYLTQSETCIDKIKDTKTVTCNEEDTDAYISLLSMTDYANTGSSSSFINNGYYNYLSNIGKEDNVWYIDDKGKLNTNDGTDIYGIKPVITLNSSVEITGGTGTKEDPYQIEQEKGLFGSYVKLNNDIWRIYEEEDNNIKLVLNNLLKVNDKNYQSIYSNVNSFHNDEKTGSLAYYLNNTYLNSFDNQDKIIKNKWANGYYSESSKFDYTTSLDSKVETKVAMLSIGDIMLVPHLDNYFLMTGVSKQSDNIYIYHKEGNVTTKKANSKANVIPTITIDKKTLTKGDGTSNSPYEMEG